MTRPLNAAAAAALLYGLALAPSCGNDSTFTIGRDLEICEDNVPTACGLPGRCVLDTSHYLAGRFPGSRRFIIRTDGEATMRLQLLLSDQRAPGTELQIIVHEPGCGDRSVWDSGGQDLFRLASAAGVVTVPLGVRQPGDHLVEFVSDAYCGYDLEWNL